MAITLAGGSGHQGSVPSFGNDHLCDPGKLLTLSELQFSSSVNMRGLGYCALFKRVLPAHICQASEIGTESFSGNLWFERDFRGLALYDKYLRF